MKVNPQEDFLFIEPFVSQRMNQIPWGAEENIEVPGAGSP